MLVVKGDRLGEQFWAAIRRVPRITWLYDELRRTQWTSERLQPLGPVATYSALDAADLHHRGAQREIFGGDLERHRTCGVRQSPSW